MNRIATWPAVVALVITISSSGNSGNLLMAAETNDPPAAIGVYDSRVIAYAHFWSEANQRKLNGLSQAAREAKAGGQEERFRELEAVLKKTQETNHLQVFSTAPVDDVLGGMRDRLPAIQKEAGVSTLVSKWDGTTLKKYQSARQIDLTDRLLREFKMDEKKMKVARDIGRKKPLSLDRAQKLVRDGKL